MTYFNPKIYNKNNLKEADLKELNYWNEQFENLIENARCDAKPYPFEDCTIIEKMEFEVIDAFCDKLREALGYTMQENVVGTIESYEEEIEEVEDYETFFYNKEDDENE